jgi:hypothetical protein
MASLLAALLALAKAFPAFAAMIERAGDELRAARLAQTHDEIDAAVSAAQRAPWVCPPACPHRLRDAGAAGETVSPTP